MVTRMRVSHALSKFPSGLGACRPRHKVKDVQRGRDVGSDATQREAEKDRGPRAVLNLAHLLF